MYVTTTNIVFILVAQFFRFVHVPFSFSSFSQCTVRILYSYIASSKTWLLNAILIAYGKKEFNEHFFPSLLIPFYPLSSFTRLPGIVCPGHLSPWCAFNADVEPKKKKAEYFCLICQVHKMPCRKDVETEKKWKMKDIQKNDDDERERENNAFVRRWQMSYRFLCVCFVFCALCCVLWSKVLILLSAISSIETNRVDFYNQLIYLSLSPSPLLCCNQKFRMRIIFSFGCELHTNFVDFYSRTLCICLSL